MPGLPPKYDPVEGRPRDTNHGGSPIKEAHQEIVAYLKTPSAREAIIRDIHNLSNIMISIEDNFATVASQMSILDGKNIVPYKFEPEWKALHKEYTDLKEDSRCAANDVSFKIDALVNNIIPVVQKDIPLDKKRGILAEYIERLEPFLPAAKENAHRFLRLGQSVSAFKSSLQDKVKTGQKDVNDKLKDIEKLLEKLEKDLEKLSYMEDRGLTFVKTISPFGNKVNKVEIAAVTALAELAPTVGKKMMEIALSYLDSNLADELKKLQQDLVGDLKRLREDLNHDSKNSHHVQDLDVASTKKDLSKLKSIYEHERDDIVEEFSDVRKVLADLDAAFKGMCNKISKIQGIWLLLLKDSQTLIHTLSDMKGTRHEEVFNGYASTLTETYKALHFSLERYSLAVPQQS
jgi:Skp family chaperone for outer membrane proteins